MFGLRCKAKRLSITKKRRSKLSFLQKQRAAIISKPCSTKHLTEAETKQIFVKALNSLVEVKENVIAELRSLIDSVCQTGELMEERDKVEQELRILAERLETLIYENARVAQDQTAYLKQENEIRALYVEKQEDMEKLDEQIAERERKRNTLEGMIHALCGINGGRLRSMRSYGAGCSITL